MAGIAGFRHIFRILVRSALRQRLPVGKSAHQLKNFLQGSVSLMQVMARACGHDSPEKFSIEDLATRSRDMALLSGARYAGVLDPST